MKIAKILWCWFRGHPYEWVQNFDALEEYRAGNYRPNIAPPSHCSNCGSETR